MLPLYVAISIPVELVFLAFHVTVWYSIVYQIANKKSPFASAFYLLYSLQSFADVGMYLTVMFKERICAYGLLPNELRPTPLVSTITFFCLAYLSCFHFVSNFAIALNRYTVMILPTVHSRIWSGKSLCIIVSLILLMPGAFSAVRLFMQCDVFDIPGGYALVPTAKLASRISGYIQVSVSLSTCLLSCSLEYGTFFAFRKMSLSSRRKYGEDYRLLLYAMMGFFAHMIMASVYVSLYVVGVFPGFLTDGYPYFVDILCLGGPVCLFYTSKHLRRKYLEFYGLRKKS